MNERVELHRLRIRQRLGPAGDSSSQRL
jgi:hypothetical protein